MIHYSTHGARSNVCLGHAGPDVRTWPMKDIWTWLVISQTNRNNECSQFNMNETVFGTALSKQSIRISCNSGAIDP